MRRALALTLLTLVMAAAGPSARAADDSWPQWLGPTRDGRAAASALKAPRLALAWKKTLGGGGSGIVAGHGASMQRMARIEGVTGAVLITVCLNEVWR